ncbi:hypothetical protein NE237_002614 [Protea cynaroides]|uniref:Phytochrome n=1 Tax=Protea cynaroides TaxID=273540 RepID=A0A9Q0KVE0_9MAGN|nr:hypothetical protein NE237_002614 [Protea cynaroides]
MISRKQQLTNMESNNPYNSSNSANSQYNADAMLLAEFEQSGDTGRSFNYSKSVKSATEPASDEQITAYLSRIQRGSHVQPFGCMLAVEEPTFRIIAYSENSIDLLGLNALVESIHLDGLLDVDARTLFTPPSGASLVKAAGSKEISLMNPVWVYSKTTQKPFYAILHRIDVGMVIDLEPARSGDPAMSVAGAVQSQKIAVRAISRLQSLPGGDIGALCDTVAEDVQRLAGYDRVMVYKFHEDEHGEVVSEVRRSDLEPYLGLHYPATDIPQAARFLFKHNRARIICDCRKSPVRVIQNEELMQPLCLVNSTLRSPHGCHAQYMVNMGSIASLVLAIVINWNTTTRLWGLVVCHHSSPRYVSFPLRYACEFLMQAFGLQLNMDLQLAGQLAEKKILKTQTLLCDMLLRDAPFGIVTQSPNIMNLVKCNGAALYYGEKCWLLGVTPTEAQIKDLANWFLTNHGDSTGLSTESLADAGYPGAALFGNAACGMAAAKISSKDILFWFRSHTAEEVKWGGAKHHPKDKDDGSKMNPRSSFKAFLEVVKSRSLPWEISEMNAIHSLQLIMRGSFQEIESSARMMSYSQKNDPEMQGTDRLSLVACELVRLIETATVPIFAVDSSGLINGWNAKMAELVGLSSSESKGKSLINEIILEESRQVAQNHLSRALKGEEDTNIELKLRTFLHQKQNSAVFIVANTCSSRDCTNSVIGACFVGQDLTGEKVIMDKFTRLQGDYKAIIQSLNPLIPPIFASDENACCYEWNAALEKLTGWTREDVIGKMLVGEIFGGLCQLKGEETFTTFMILLYQTLGGHDTEKLIFGFYDRKGKYVEAFLTANKRTNKDGQIIGCFCFLQTIMPDLQHALEVQRQEEKGFTRLKELAYIRQEMKNPLNGIRFTHKLLENTVDSDYQKQFLETSDACEKQILTIIEDIKLGSIEEGTVELNAVEFVLGNVLDVVISQVMISLTEKKLHLIHEIPEEVRTLPLYGDQIRLQQVLSDFLINIVHHTPAPDGWVEIKVTPSLRLIQDVVEFVHLQIRMTHPGRGLPSEVVQDMFEAGTKWATEQGLGLSLSRQLLKMMNGQVRYLRETSNCYFLIDIELQASQKRSKGLELDVTKPT